MFKYINKNLFTSPLLFLCVCFVAQSLLWNVNVLPKNPPDEFSHFDYISYLYTYKNLPIYGKTEYIYTQGLNAHASIPPLYYLLCVPIKAITSSQPINVQYHFIRLVSTILGLVTLIYSYRTVLLIKPKSEILALSIASLVTLNPMFTYMSSAINSDNMINCLYAVLVYHITYGVIKLDKLDKNWLLKLGIINGLGLITKPTILPGIILSIVFVVWKATDEDNKIQTLLFYIKWSLLSLFIVSGWSFIRNWYLYNDPTGLFILGKFNNIYSFRPYYKSGNIYDLILSSGFTYVITYSFWGVFDHLNIFYSKNMYELFINLSIVGTISSILSVFIKKLYKNKINFRIITLYSLLITMTIVLIVYTSYKVDFQPQGRYLFPALLPFTIMVSLGIEYLFRIIHIAKLFPIVAMCFIITTNNIAFFSAIAPSQHRYSLYNVARDNPEQKVSTNDIASYKFIAKSNTIYFIEIFANISDVPNGNFNLAISDDTGMIVGYANRFIENSKYTNQSSFIFYTENIPFIKQNIYTITITSKYRIPSDAITVPFDPDSQDQEIIQKMDADPILYYDSSRMSHYYENYPYNLLSYSSEMSIYIQRYLFYIIPVLWLFFIMYTTFVYYRPTYILILPIFIIIFGILQWGQPLALWTREQGRSDVLPPSLYAEYAQGVIADLFWLSDTPLAQQQHSIDDSTGIPLISRLKYTINDDTRDVLTMHPTNAITYTIPITQNVKVDTAIALDPTVWSPDKGDGVVFQVRVTTPTTQKTIFSQYIDPKNNPQDRTWIPVSFDLSAYKEQTIQLTLATSPGPQNNVQYDWAGWSRPLLILEK